MISTDVHVKTLGEMMRKRSPDKSLSRRPACDLTSKSGEERVIHFCGISIKIVLFDKKNKTGANKKTTESKGM